MNHKYKKAAPIIVATLIGILLFTSVLLTGTHGLGKEDRLCYETALSLQEEMSDLGFPNFMLTDYPMAFNDGKSDYVLTWQNGSYEVLKRAPYTDAFAATAVYVNDHYEVLVPTKERMSNLVGLMGGNYENTEQAATIWHEAFHCWQFTHFKENILALIGNHSFEDADFGENLIVSQYDANIQAVALWEKQSDLLSQALKESDTDNLRALMLEYKKLEEERIALLDDNTRRLESYYITVEGTARYVEANAFKLLKEESFTDRYLANIAEYTKGTEKYYSIGMAQCFILDKLDENWKDHYDFSVPPIEIIYEKLGV
ncbi:MAG: hypothetical protein J1E83_08715 [Lachnospiraceae bacterium]|nr:hypothetical protein [Lachnospiraceae bacterium]